MNQSIQREYKLFFDYIQEISGICLNMEKAYLLENRLKGLMARTGSGSYTELYHKIVQDPTGRLRQSLIDAVCTGETLFFRDQYPFEILKSVIIPELIETTQAIGGNTRKQVRVLSAGCSFGQELVSIAIILMESKLKSLGYDFQLVGIDISQSAIDYAKKGCYRRVEMERGLSEKMWEKYFHRIDDQWLVTEPIRSICSFQQGNLLQPMSGLTRFDVVFCRNVGIYFSMKDRDRLMRRMARALKPNGYLILGSSESLNNTTDEFRIRKMGKRFFYQYIGSDP